MTITVLARLGRCDEAIALADQVEAVSDEKEPALLVVTVKLFEPLSCR